MFTQQLPGESVILRLTKTSILKEKASLSPELSVFWQTPRNVDLNYFISVIFRIIWEGSKENFCNRKRRQMGNAMSCIKAVCDDICKSYLVLIWGTQSTARCSDLSEISQQSRGRTLSHLVHLEITYEWHVAMHSPLIYLILHLWSWSSWDLFDRQGTQTHFVMLMIHRFLFHHTLMFWYILGVSL